LGLLAITALLDIAGIVGVLRAPENEIVLRGALAGLALAVAGLASSTLHLANPKNAWRSAARFRTSWLSREAVFAIALLAVAATYAGAVWIGAGPFARGVLALLATVLAWTVVLCTAMIYASLRPIRQWHTRLTPASYLALAHWSGALVLLTIVLTLAPSGADARLSLPAVLVGACVLGVASLLIKAAWWRRAAGATAGRWRRRRRRRGRGGWR
jgi:DMSO reductase anchor subunit